MRLQKPLTPKNTVIFRHRRSPSLRSFAKVKSFLLEVAYLDDGKLDEEPYRSTAISDRLEADYLATAEVTVSKRYYTEDEVTKVAIDKSQQAVTERAEVQSFLVSAEEWSHDSSLPHTVAPMIRHGRQRRYSGTQSAPDLYGLPEHKAPKAIDPGEIKPEYWGLHP